MGEGLTLDEAALAALEAYAWPGNVRELQNVIERACALADGSDGQAARPARLRPRSPLAAAAAG